MNEHERALLRSGTFPVLELLEDRGWHTAAEIEERCNVTAHSRLSELRGDGCVIDKRRNPQATGRRMFSYRLVASAEEMAALDESEARQPAAADSGSSSAGGSERSGSVVGAAGVGASAAPDGELEDAGWRDLFPAESAGEALPPPSCGQLPLLDEVAF
jgi:hypothetical protein